MGRYSACGSKSVFQGEGVFIMFFRETTLLTLSKSITSQLVTSRYILPKGLNKGMWEVRQWSGVYICVVTGFICKFFSVIGGGMFCLILMTFKNEFICLTLQISYITKMKNYLNF